MGKLLGFNVDLKSYRFFRSDGVEIKTVSAPCCATSGLPGTPPARFAPAASSGTTLVCLILLQSSCVYHAHKVWLEHFNTPNKHLNTTWARLCIQCFMQTHRKDFFDTFSPTGKFPSLLTLVVLAIDLKLPIEFDVKSAFLFAPLEEEIYIKTPEGSKQNAPYLKLEKSLYRLKQVPKNCLQCVRFHPQRQGLLYLISYLFLKCFPNSTAHNPDTLLGMKLNTSSKAIRLSQPTLIKKGLEICRLPLKNIINYLACQNRPDLASAVSILSIFNQCPGLTHWKAMLHVWKYLKCTQDFGLILKPDPSLLSDCILFYTNPTWAKNQETRILQSGSIVFWNSFPILWNIKNKKNITMSSTESELNALVDGEQENQWLTFLIKELWKLKNDTTLFHMDNFGLMEKLKNLGENSKTKHLDIKIKNLREKYKNKEIDDKRISSKNMIANSLSKAAQHTSIKKLQDQCLTVILPSKQEGC
ncbi:hypothetical protein VP01_1465g4 [Puccinia sorghi]|uniref:Reverse transcriptase Ty1/copia-type domain-containing protein n=1 Tax=Puccinia sorghi TaxID=27349 RepID=A0A0L6VJS4_9BASI|nr:hypothetical protein VP01_1465g4 [Puccinia sorghi]